MTTQPKETLLLFFTILFYAHGFLEGAFMVYTSIPRLRTIRDVDHHSLLRSPNLCNGLRDDSRATAQTTRQYMLEDGSTTLLLAETESWRQYVPLVASALVIVDVALGSPAANAVLGKVRGPKPGESSNESATPGVNPKERIDTQQVAQAALDKASSTLELKKYLEDNKTDWDRMEDIRRKMDEDMENFDRRSAKPPG